ncbi:MAG: hypothetical protein WA441_12970 [Methyloceanibacter sp.]
MDGARFENGCQTLGPERDLGERIIVGQGGQYHIASGKIAQPRCNGSADQGRCLLRVSVIDEHLITVFDKIDGKGVSIWPRPITPTRKSSRAVIDPEGRVVSEVVMTFLSWEGNG